MGWPVRRDLALPAVQEDSMFLAFRHLLPSGLAGLALAGSCAAQPVPYLSDAGLGKLHAEIGQTIDRRYYAAGRRVDLARYDFEELTRQGRPAPRALLARVGRDDSALRSRWQDLENRVGGHPVRQGRVAGWCER
jgi:hypothetical protein